MFVSNGDLKFSRDKLIMDVNLMLRSQGILKKERGKNLRNRNIVIKPFGLKRDYETVNIINWKNEKVFTTHKSIRKTISYAPISKNRAVSKEKYQLNSPSVIKAKYKLMRRALKNRSTHQSVLNKTSLSLNRCKRKQILAKFMLGPLKRVS
ncbi:unnamed protein product [Moneuplotes crassus]|uniref:Uncharacterized protein n=1 Tax=Euplotes crassus TaxID=5936 RepID=A0AAD1XSI9_EUPCR|nr:unnamed protein product [Moneuplotes crassus]